MGFNSGFKGLKTQHLGHIVVFRCSFSFHLLRYINKQNTCCCRSPNIHEQSSTHRKWGSCVTCHVPAQLLSATSITQSSLHLVRRVLPKLCFHDLQSLICGHLRVKHSVLQNTTLQEALPEQHCISNTHTHLLVLSLIMGHRCLFMSFHNFLITFNVNM